MIDVTANYVSICREDIFMLHHGPEKNKTVENPLFKESWKERKPFLTWFIQRMLVVIFREINVLDVYL